MMSAPASPFTVSVPAPPASVSASLPPLMVSLPASPYSWSAPVSPVMYRVRAAPDEVPARAAVDHVVARATDHQVVLSARRWRWCRRPRRRRGCPHPACRRARLSSHARPTGVFVALRRRTRRSMLAAPASGVSLPLSPNSSRRRLAQQRVVAAPPFVTSLPCAAAHRRVVARHGRDAGQVTRVLPMAASSSPATADDVVAVLAGDACRSPRRRRDRVVVDPSRGSCPPRAAVDDVRPAPPFRSSSPPVPPTVVDPRRPATGLPGRTGGLTPRC